MEDAALTDEERHEEEKKSPDYTLRFEIYFPGMGL
jgi:hypothetical protein